jgi:hypothetical protein
MTTRIRSLWRSVPVVALAVLLSACGTISRISWPWSKDPPPAPEAVNELVITSDAGATIPQYWQRNTLVLDMTGVPASGTATARPAFARGWPVRVAVRAMPGQFGAVEVRGSRRFVLLITTEGTTPVERELPPSVHSRGTPSLELRWGANARGGAVQSPGA